MLQYNQSNLLSISKIIIKLKSSRMSSSDKIVQEIKREKDRSTNLKIQTLKEKNESESSPQKNNYNEQIIQNEMQKTKSSQDSDLIIVKSIKQLEFFFDKKYLGNKNQSKSHDLQRLKKMPTFSSTNFQNLIDLKTGNLNTKMKEIETIFKVQQKNKNKKKIIDANFTDFQLYLAKRDILKQKNQCIDQIRKNYEQDKRKTKEQRTIKKKKTFSKQYSTKNLQSDSQNKKQAYKTQSYQEKIYENPQNSQLYQKDSLVRSGQNIQNGLKLMDKTVQKKNNTFNSQIILKPFEDDYFQKKFEQNIVKNKFAITPGFSIRALLQPSNKRKTTIDENEIMKKQFNQIQNIAKNTLQNFQKKQKINKILFKQNLQSESNPTSAFNSKRQTPVILQNDPFSQAKRKSINWIIKECEVFKKKFNIRKSKSLKTIGKNV